MAKEQRLTIFRGDVQGVGFRFAAFKLARRYDITGYVRNLDDGSVELLTEGEPSEIGKFVNEIAERFSGYIRKTDYQVLPFTGQFSGFTIE